MTRSEAYWILEEIRNECFSAQHAEALHIAQSDVEFVDLMPNDMVHVVRCKDCKWYDEDCEFCDFWGSLRVPEHFCGEGERKDNG